MRIKKPFVIGYAGAAHQNHCSSNNNGGDIGAAHQNLCSLNNNGAYTGAEHRNIFTVSLKKQISIRLIAFEAAFEKTQPDTPIEANFCHLQRVKNRFSVPHQRNILQWTNYNLQMLLHD